MIREIFLLLLILGFCIALEDPPVEEVVQHNQGLGAEKLMGNATINVSFGSYATGAGVRIITVLPAVDNRIPPDAEGVLWGWNEEYEDEINISEYTCYISNRSLQANMYFEFRNENMSVGLSGINPIINIPFDVELLETANGTENLTVILEGNYFYAYECPVGGNGTGITYESSISVYDRSEFIVEPGKANFFLVRPVIGEQWYQNNHFDTLVFSRKSIYKSEISMDGNETAYARIYDFSVLKDPMGAWHIIVNETQNFSNASMENYEISYWANPVVKEDNPFSHLYEVNYTYDGWGPHWMNITVTDFFLGEHTYAREILSRKITRQGVSETGEPAGSEEYYRPGEPELEKTEITHYLLPSNEIIMVFLVASLWMFWHYSKSGKSR